MKRILSIVLLLSLLFVSSACGQSVIGGDVFGGGGGTGNPDYIARFSPSAWYSGDYGAYQDAAVQLVAADKSCLVAADHATLDAGTNDLLLCCWAKMDSYTAVRVLIAKGATSAGVDGYALYVDTNGKARAVFVDQNTDNTTAAGSTVLGTGWRFLAAHYDRSGLLTLYVDGAVEATRDISAHNGSDCSNAVGLSLGAYIGSVLPHDGRLDSVMIFKAADLSAVAPAIISWAYNSGSGRLCSELDPASATGVAWGAISGWELGETSGARYDSWGSNHLSQAFSPIIRPTTYGSELLSNGGIETVTGTADDGVDDAFTSWGVQGTDGSADSTLTAYAGSKALKMTAGATKDKNVFQTYASAVAGTVMRFSFWTQGDGTNAGRYRIRNATGGTEIVSTTSTGVTGTNWTLVTSDFTVPAGCTSITVYAYCPNAAGGFALFDNISLKAVTTAALNNGGFESWNVPSAVELVVNGNFTSNITGWTNHATDSWETAEWVGGAAHLACTGDGAPAVSRFYSTALSVTSGAVYRIRYTITRNSGTAVIAAVLRQSPTGGVNSGYVSSGGGTATVDTYFVATETAAVTYLMFFSANSAAGDFTIDSVSIQAVPFNADTWTESVAGSSLIYRGDAPYSGSHALAMQVDASNNLAQVYTTPFTAGKLYSLSCYAKVATGTGSILFGSPTNYVNGSLNTTYALVSGTTRASNTTFAVNRGVSPTCASNTVFIDSLTVTAAEILPAAGIVRGAAADSNFAMQLNGTSQYASYTGTAFNPETGDFSVAVAFYADSFAGVTDRYLVSMGSYAAGQDGVIIYVAAATRKVGFYINESAGSSSTYSTETVSVGNWNTLIYKADRDGNGYYSLNGSSFASLGSLSAVTGSISPGNLRIGCYSVSISNLFSGRIDNVCYVNRLIDDDEATWLHNNGEWRQWAELGVAGTDGAALTSSVVKGMWEFDDKSFASSAVDSTGNGNTLTASGTPTRGYGINYLAGMVSYWADRSGNGYNALSTALANRMGYCTNALNGYPVLCGDGIDDVATTTLAGQAAASIFFVGKINAASDVPVGVMETNNRSFIGSSAADKFAGGVATQDTNVITSNDDPGTSFYGSLIYDGSTVTLRRNGTQEYSSAQSGTVSTALTYALGARRTGAAAFDAYLDGEIAEIVIFPGAVTTDERAGIEAHFAWKYGIAP